MSGTLHGSIDHNITTANANMSRDIFAATVRFFDSRFVRIASQKGSGFNGTGDIAGYTSDTNRSGDNAFGVWRWDRVDGKKIYILVQWGWSSAIGTSPGNPATPNQLSFGVGIQFAMRLDAGNPWNGGTANALADTKNATNVWVDGGSTLVVWPRTNGPGGSSTAKSGLAGLSNYGSTNCRFSIMHDDTGIYWFSDQDGGNYNNMGFFCNFTPRSGITPNVGIICYTQNTTTMPTLSGLAGSDVGTTAGTSAYEGGAAVQAADGVRTCRLTAINGMGSTAFQMNSYVSAFDILDVFTVMEDLTAPAKRGLFGKLDANDIALTWNMSNIDTNVGKTRICIGPSIANDFHWLFRWDGVTTPHTTVAQTGVQF